MEDQVRLLRLATRLVYSIDDLSDDLRIYWSRLLRVIFEDHLAETNRQYEESQSALRKFHSRDSLLEFLKDEEKSALTLATSLITLVKDHAVKKNDPLMIHRLDDLISLVAREFDLNKQEIEEASVLFKAQMELVEKRPVLRISAHIWPLVLLDQALRWGLLALYNHGLIRNVIMTVVGNLLVVPLFVLVVIILKSRTDKKHNQQLLLNYGVAHRFILRFHLSAAQYTWLVFSIASSLFINFLLNQDDSSIGILSFFLLGAFIVYYWACLRFFGIGRINERALAELESSLEEKEKNLNADENDEHIVRVETKLTGITSRLEAYVLESALFGALSFSGFLQIIANNIVTFKDMEQFASLATTTANGFVRFQWTDFSNGIAQLNNNTSLFCLVSAESLVCSIFFLAVIASRLQFSDIADRVRETLQLAKAYNAKEESLLEQESLSQKGDERMRTLNEKVNTNLEISEATLHEIDPVVQYMQYFRNAGIVVFLIILVTSSLFISGALAWGFAALGIATLIYFNRRSLRQRTNVLLLTLRIQFSSRGKWLWIMSLAFLPAAYVFRFYSLEVTSTVFLFLAIVGLGTYWVVWLFLKPHIDPKFGEMKTGDQQESESKWKPVQTLFGVGLICLVLGYSMKVIRLTGANEFLMIGGLFLSVMSFFISYFLVKRKWLMVFAGWSFSATGIGIVFRTLHLAGATEVLRIGLILTLIFFLLVVIKRPWFHVMIIQIMAVVLFAAIFYSSGSYRSLQNWFRTVYAHKTFDVSMPWNAEDALEMFYDDRLSLKKKAERLDNSIRITNRYLLTFAADAGLTDTDHYLIANYYTIAHSAVGSLDTMKSTSDKALAIEMGLKAGREADHIFTLFPDAMDPFYVGSEAWVLAALNRKEEAISSLQTILRQNPPEEVARYLKMKIEAWRGN
jgi:hypothetical protein